MPSGGCSLMKRDAAIRNANGRSGRIVIAATLTIDALVDSIATLLNQNPLKSATMTALGFNPMRDYQEFVDARRLLRPVFGKEVRLPQTIRRLCEARFCASVADNSLGGTVSFRACDIGHGASHSVDALHPSVPRRLSRHARRSSSLGEFRGLETPSRQASRRTPTRFGGYNKFSTFQDITNLPPSQSPIPAIPSPKCVGTGSRGTTRARSASTFWSVSFTAGRISAASSPKPISNPSSPRYARSAIVLSVVLRGPDRRGVSPATASPRA